MNNPILRFRIPFILLAMLNLIAGLWSGLIRIGWSLPLPSVAVHHGAIMVGGFLTTLIALEKAVPMKRKIAFTVPVLSALSLMMTKNEYYKVGLGFLLAGSVGLMIIQGWYLHKHPTDRSALLMVIGASLLVTGNVFLLTSRFYPSSFPWWMGFVLFTIVGERLELSQFLPVSEKAKLYLFIFLGCFVVGLVLPFHGYGKYVSGIALIWTGIWMLRHDIITVGLKSSGLTKYSAAALLLANLALMLEGIFLITLPNTMLSYDTLVHTFFIGFAFTMVFAHGPIILPAVLGISVKPYSPILYCWLVLLQFSLYLLVFSNSIVEIDLRRHSGLITGSSILLYFITIIFALLWHPRQKLN